MKPISKIFITIFLAAILISSCIGPQFWPKTEPTIAMETALAEVRTAVVGTQTAQPTFTPTPTYPPSLTPTNTPQPRQTYTDPEGWYTVSFPIDWKPADNKPNSFRGNDGLFETGYLPEMGYVSNALIVCGWIANIEANPEKSTIDWFSYWQQSATFTTANCSVSAEMDSGDKFNYKIYENPGADVEHRFIYLKTKHSPPNAYNSSVIFSWTKPVYRTKFDPGIVPLSPEESDFWGDPSSMPSNISVTEFMLPPEAQAGPSEVMFYQFVPEDLYREESQISTSTPDEKPTTEEQLKSLGYELKVVDDNPNHWQQQFSRDGRLLFDNVFSVSDVYEYSTDSGSITAFIVTTAKVPHSADFSSFLIQNDAIYVWNYSTQDRPFPPVLYQGELLWAKAAQGSHMQILKSNRDVVYSFAAYTELLYSVERFTTWNNHWILEAQDFIIQDGEILNEKLRYLEMFDWELVKDKPTYFFRKGSRIGISYGDKILPIQYQDVAYGFCCGFASNNPRMSHDSIRFFGKRDGAWYYVVVKFE